VIATYAVSTDAAERRRMWIIARHITNA